MRELEMKQKRLWNKRVNMRNSLCERGRGERSHPVATVDTDLSKHK